MSQNKGTRIRTLIESADIDELMKIINGAGIKLEDREFDNSMQDSYNHETINGPSTYRGRPYSPLSFEYKADQIEQAEKILEKKGLI